MKKNNMFVVIFLLGSISCSAYAHDKGKNELEISPIIDSVIDTQKLSEEHQKKEFKYDFMSDRVTLTNLVDQFIKKNEHFFEVQEDDEKAFSQEFLKIFLVCVSSMVAYGIIHDQITAHLCIEYFNSYAIPENRRRLNNFSFISYNSPLAVGLTMALSETLLPAILMGAAAGGAARVGSAQKLKFRDLSIHIAGLFGAIGISSCVAGLIGYLIGQLFFGAVLPHERHIYIPGNKNGLFTAAAFAHATASTTALIGTVFLVTSILFKRGIFTSKINETDRQEIKQLLTELQRTLGTEPPHLRVLRRPTLASRAL